MPYVIGFFTAVIIPLIPVIARNIAVFTATALGFSLVSYVGASAAIDSLKDYIQTNFDGMPRDITQVLALSGADIAINVVLSCVVFSLSLNGLMKASGYKPSWRKPQ